MDPTNGSPCERTPEQCCCHAEHLTDRELEVLCYLAAGLTNEEAAEKMHVSAHTIAGHVQTMRGRFGARTRTDLVFRASAAGLLKPVWPPSLTGRRCVPLRG
ncbi:MAG TPA: helix-turn-helix transcriptional regulator [Streptosporangiaceae bacterium]